MSELGGREEQAEQATQSQRALTSTFDITDDVAFKKHTLGHHHQQYYTGESLSVFLISI